jgi:hypothetical protein
MFSKSTYLNRRQTLKSKLGSGLILFLGNEESGMNYRDNVYPFRQDSTFLYYFGIDQASLTPSSTSITISEIIFGDELTIDDIVWTGPKEAFSEKAAKVGVTEVKPASAVGFLHALSRQQTKFIFCRHTAASIT